MAVYQPQPEAQTAPVAPAAAPAPEQGSRQGAALLAALLCALAYAVFAHGAQTYPYETRVQLVLGALCLAAIAAWASGRLLVADLRPGARLGVGLLAGLAVWTAVTQLWSITPDRTWMEFNRAVAYALIAGLAVLAGANARRAVERLAGAWLVIATVVALYALAGKALPGLHMLGLDLRQSATLPRLRAPLDYWNALALVCALAIPIAMKVGADAAASTRVRVASFMSLYVLVIVMGMTYSRGGLLALGTALIVMTLMGTGRLRALGVLGVALLAATEPIGLAFAKNQLKTTNAPLHERIDAGNLLLSAVVGCAIVLLITAVAIVKLDRAGYLRWSGADSRALWRAVAIVLSFAVMCGAVLAASSQRGLPGTVRHVVTSFTETKQDKQLDPERLASTNSGNRWVWWKEAVGAWSDKPLGGWGAGSFRATHLMYRDNTLPVTQPHSVPLQFLAETGLIGLLLAAGGIGALMWAAWSRLGELAKWPVSRERELAVALFAASAGWIAHGFYDWDWDIPGVSLPPLLFLGVLAGGGAVAVRQAPRTPRVIFVDPTRGPGLDWGKAVVVAVATIVVALYAASAILPEWADSKSSDAQASIGEGDPSAQKLQHAAAQARIASKLDPFSVDPLFASAVIATRRGRLLEARDYLLQAVDRQPDNARAWGELARVALVVADRAGFERASLKALALDPKNPILRLNAQRAVALATPPGDSATATGTPLPGVTG